MERFIIERLGGVTSHPVEGRRTGPFKVKGLSLRREGGYVPIGGVNDSWLGEAGPSGIVYEDRDAILAENGDIIVSEWSASPDLSGPDMIGYDETGFTLLSDGRVWFGTGVAATPFLNVSELSIAPRSAILAPWKIFDPEAPGEVEYRGGAVFEDQAGTLSDGDGPGNVAITENAGSGIPAGIYEYIWLVEAPTTNGLVVHSVGYHVDSVAAEQGSLDLELDTVFPADTVIRFYYRGPDQGAATSEPTGMEFFGAVVSDGQNLPTVRLSDLGTTFFPSDDVLLSFAPGRLEAHNGRMWGAAAERPFQPILSQYTYSESTERYMLVSGGNFYTVFQSVPLSSPDRHIFRDPGDYVRMVIPRLTVRRMRSDVPTIVPLFVDELASPTYHMGAYLQWDPGSTYPRLRVHGSSTMGDIGPDAADILLEHSALVLGAKQGSERVARNVDLTITLDSAVASGSGHDVTMTVELLAGDVQINFVATGTKLAEGWSGWVGFVAGGTLYVGKAAEELAFDASWGAREMRISLVEAGSTLGADVYGSIADYDSDTSELTWVSSGPNGETWSVSDSNYMLVELIQGDPDFDPNPTSIRSTTLVYSTVGSVNRGSSTNFLPLSPLTSNRITALASTPAGLLVFMENETFLVRGDPDLQDLSVQRLSGTLGCDPNVIPARLGSVVMPIYQGEIYAVNLGGGDVDFGGNMVNVSKPVWDQDDPFVQVVGEPVRNHVVARTNSGRVYRLDTESQEWINDVFDEYPDLRWLTPASSGLRFGTIYNVDGYMFVLDSDGTSTPEVVWDALDLGDKNVMKLWRRIELFTEGQGDGAPTMTFTVRGVTGTVTGLDQGEGRWVFTFPRGMVGPHADLAFEFPGATDDLVIEPPIAIEYQPRYRER